MHRRPAWRTRSKCPWLSESLLSENLEAETWHGMGFFEAEDPRSQFEALSGEMRLALARIKVKHPDEAVFVTSCPVTRLSSRHTTMFVLEDASCGFVLSFLSFFCNTLRQCFSRGCRYKREVSCGASLTVVMRVVDKRVSGNWWWEQYIAFYALYRWLCVVCNRERYNSKHSFFVARISLYAVLVGCWRLRCLRGGRKSPKGFFF